MNIHEASTAFGQPVSYVEAVAKGRKMKGKATLDVPTDFDVRRMQVTRDIGALKVVMTRRELWGDDRLLWTIESGASEPSRTA